MVQPDKRIAVFLHHVSGSESFVLQLLPSIDDFSIRKVIWNPFITVPQGL